MVQIVLQDKRELHFIEECNIQTHTNVIICLLINLKKNYKRTLRYRFVNVFPKSINPVPVSYGAADI